MSGRRAGCPGLQEVPDVWAEELASVGSSAWRQIFGRLAGFPVSGLGPDVRAGAGCPGL